MEVAFFRRGNTGEVTMIHTAPTVGFGRVKVIGYANVFVARTAKFRPGRNACSAHTTQSSAAGMEWYGMVEVCESAP